MPSVFAIIRNRRLPSHFCLLHRRGLHQHARCEYQHQLDSSRRQQFLKISSIGGNCDKGVLRGSSNATKYARNYPIQSSERDKTPRIVTTIERNDVGACHRWMAMMAGRRRRSERSSDGANSQIAVLISSMLAFAIAALIMEWKWRWMQCIVYINR